MVPSFLHISCIEPTFFQGIMKPYSLFVLVTISKSSLLLITFFFNHEDIALSALDLQSDHESDLPLPFGYLLIELLFQSQYRIILTL